MSKFIGLKTQGDKESVIVNIDAINLLCVEDAEVTMNDGTIIQLNSNSTKFLLEILMENEYKLRSEAE